MWHAYPRHSVNLSAGCYAALIGALARGQVLEGPGVDKFETHFARYIGVRHALGTSSGRAALYLAFSALGFKPGDEIIMPAYTFHIVPLVIRACGLTPVFIDVRPDTYNMDVSLVKGAITPKTRAILATHMYGQPCDLEPLLKIAAAHDLKILEDCAHACGALYKGRKLGSFGDLGLFTFAMAKNMPCFGGGMITVNDSGLYRRLVGLIQPPQSRRHKSLWKEVALTTVNYVCTLPRVFSVVIYPLMRLLNAMGRPVFDREPGQETVSAADLSAGYVVRLTNLQAVVGLHQLTRIDEINARVNRNARWYGDHLKGLEGVRTPQTAVGRTHTFLYYRLEVEQRDRLRAELFKKGVDTAADDMSDCSTLAPFKETEWTLPVAGRLPGRILEIPNNPRLKKTDVAVISRCIGEVA